MSTIGKMAPTKTMAGIIINMSNGLRYTGDCGEKTGQRKHETQLENKCEALVSIIYNIICKNYSCKVYYP